MLKRRVLYAAMAACAVSCSAHAAPPMTDAEWTAYEESHTRFILQQFGADPETARWAAWAMKYQPSSRCAMSARPVVHAVEGGMSLFPGEGEGMVVDHICEPEALKHDALTIPPFSAIEGENERLQWGVTSTARNKVIAAILERQKKQQKQDAREYGKNLRPPAYLTAPDSKYFVDQCRFVKLGFDSIEEANEAGEGEVRATCSFALGDDNYWRVKGCHLVPKKGTSQEVMDASKRYLSSACWEKDNFHTELDKNGIGTTILTFSLGDEWITH
ncbi:MULTISPECIES: hypothetical protein [unclassified Parasaccharibacter]|uniref:hypothetical protein n=1 Tax=unclassified Parasaccharibacter TaxID=2626400 RepID=UPI00200A8D06|nr:MULTISPECIES: hypothetical protein [unclassified Parasaccharibacter]